MKILVFVLLVTLLLTNGVSAKQSMPLSLKDGEYIFEHKYAEAEQYRIESIKLLVKITGNHIVVINNDRFDVFPKGILEEGTLIWHSKSSQWIIGESPADREADDVGGCSDGPTVVDLVKRIYWTC